MSNESLTIIGGGLTGAMMACFAASRDLRVDLYEQRFDPRQDERPDRSLLLNKRGLQALEALDLAAQVREQAVALRRRIDHLPDGRLEQSPLCKQGGELLAISHNRLLGLLLDCAEHREGARMHFRQRCDDIDLATANPRMLELSNNRRYDVPSNAVIATDGAFSAVRQRMQKTGQFDFQQSWLPFRYKHITLPDTLPLDEQALHVWSGEGFSLVVIPRLQGGFHGYLYTLQGAPTSFEHMAQASDLIDFVRQHLPELDAYAPELAEELLEQSAGSLMTLRCGSFHFRDRALLMGDAAHTCSPFSLQGLNASFEDCLALDSILDQHRDLAEAFELFSQERTPEADALAQLSDDFAPNLRYVPTQSSTRAQLHDLLARLFPAWYAPLELELASSTAPYQSLHEQAARQTRLLDLLHALAPLLLGLALLLIYFFVFAASPLR